MKQSLLKHFLLATAIVTQLSQSIIAAPSLSSSEKAELALAIARGPLGTTLACIDTNNLESRGLVRVLNHLLTISNDALAIYNRDRESHVYEYVRIAHDTLRCVYDATTISQEQDNAFELSIKDKELEAQLVTAFRHLLPLVESTGAVYSAYTTTDKTADAHKKRCLAQGFVSLAHHINGYLSTSNTELGYAELAATAATISLIIYHLQADEVLFEPKVKKVPNPQPDTNSNTKPEAKSDTEPQEKDKLPKIKPILKKKRSRKTSTSPHTPKKVAFTPKTKGDPKTTKHFGPDVTFEEVSDDEEEIVL